MNWLLQEEIKRRAELSDEEALNVSIEHWEQICEAVEAEEALEGRFQCTECGLCQRYDKVACGGCPLYNSKDDDTCCCQEWQTFYNDHTLANAQAMLNRLYLERGKRYGQPKKECKKEKPKELREGDYEIDKNKIPIVWLRDGRGELWPNTPKGKEYPGNGIFDNDFELILGNIFDDLERNSKDLEEFTVSDEDGTLGFEAVKQCGHNTIWIKLHPKSHFFNLEQSESIGKQLLRIVATARREAKKDC